jgi:[acyl-carrier-protein] S-malonyltransferase
MEPAAAKLRIRLESTPLAERSAVKVYGVDCKIHVGADEIRGSLVRQMSTPVYWAATVRTMISAGATQIIECGPGKVLTALNRRADRNRDLQMLALEDPQSLDDALAAVT